MPSRHLVMGKIARPNCLSARRSELVSLILHYAEPIWFVFLWRAVLVLFTALVASFHYDAPPPTSLIALLDRTLVQWDSGFYLTIARDGYASDPGTVAFYPLLPLLIRAAHWVIPSWRAAGALVVHVALAAALVYLHALARLDYDRDTARRAIVFALLFPTAIFFGAIYTESLLLLTITASLYHARRGQWWVASLWGVLAGLTKMIGGVVLVALLWEYWRAAMWRRTAEGSSPDWRRLARTLPALALVPLGALAHLIGLHLAFGSYRIYFDTQGGFGRGSFFRPFIPDGWHFLAAWLRGEGDAVVNYFYPQRGYTQPSTHAFMAIDLAFLVVFAIVGIVLCLRVRGSYGLLVFAVLGMAAFSGSPQAINRYTAILSPAFIGFALAARRPVSGFGLFALSSTLFAFFTFLFVGDYWAG